MTRDAAWEAFCARSVPGVRLDAYRLSYSRDMARGDYTGYTTWSLNFDEPLGQARALIQWVHRRQGASEATARRVAKLVGLCADACGGVRYIGDRTQVPAQLLHDWNALGARIEEIATASWCAACGAEPCATPAFLCVWCAAAPVGRAA